ncbi:MAG: indolepyruvate oxidoreductase subunit beta [Desulfurococcales archaeon]|nr:indolepyruvate oxidoreductase subunit beta [Desulfurococcales archaeon]
MNDKVNILIAGVGGQGLITMSNVLAKASLLNNVKALVAETHGLSQRGGSVEVHVRIGNVYSPLIPLGGADIVVGMELIEAARYLRYIKRGGVVVVNDRIIRPAVPGIEQPSKEELLEYIMKHSGSVYMIDALKYALEAGSALSQNMVILGSLFSTGLLDEFVSTDSVRKVIRTMRHHEINEKAFELGLSNTRVLKD